MTKIQKSSLRQIQKRIIGILNIIRPFNYKKFWDERYKKYGFNIKYSGNKELGNGENIEKYEKSMYHLLKIIRNFDLSKNCSILDIGCGVGIYADYFLKNGFRNYTGIDLNENIIKILNKKFPDNYKFFQKDIFKEKIKETYDLILMISVTGHIIDDKDFYFVMKNVKNSLNRKGYFFVTDRLIKDVRTSYYTRIRTLRHYEKIFGKPIKIIEGFRGKEKKLLIWQNH